MKKYFVFAFVLIFISISLFAENDPKVPITRIENSTGIAPFSQVRIRHEEPVTFLRQETAYGNNVTADNWYSLDTGTMVATTIAPVTYACFSGDYGIQGFFAIDYNTDNLLQIDPDTGAETIIGYMPCPLAASGGIWSDLFCDKTTGNWYSIAVDLIVNSQIYSVDITNASITWVADLISTGTISGAVDQNGLLYTLCIVTDSTYETDLSTYTTTLLGPAGFDANYAQGAAYEPIDDIFYFAAYSTSAELRSLNRVSGATTYVGALPGETGAFGFPGSIAPAEAPAAPTDVVVTPDAGGALVADIDWVCPTEQVNGDPLTELLEMRVYRDDVLIYTDSSPTIGGPGSYADVFVPLAGQYTYKVVGYNSAGEGLPAIVTVWVGEDVPNAVTDLTLTDVSTDDLMAQLDWVNPTTGLHGGYFPGVTGYDIERSDGATFTIGGPVTLWIDDTIVDPGIYWYAVTPFNNSGSGPSTQTPSVGIGISVIEVGNAEITDYQIPMNIWYQNNITECVYDKEWIGTGMIINAIAFHAANITSTINPFNFEIWFGEIDIDDLSGGWIDASQLTMVFDGTIDVPTGEYWLEIPLDTPFIYENNDNLVMGIIKDDDEYYSTSDVWYTTQSGTANRTLHEYSDSQEFSIQSPPGSSNPKTTYPDIRLYYSGIADPLAPGEPTDVTFIPDAGGDPECDISWTCASLNYGGDPLAELLEMRVYRDGALVY
ncbi:MAG: hypothetical protein KAU01_02265, partial [Candidatus Cloacimonetes bacterium]|nr:hypothetical protein [Candidatus Cloacimonadota bacterium]